MDGWTMFFVLMGVCNVTSAIMKLVDAIEGRI